MKTPEEIDMNLENAYVLRETAKSHSMGYCDYLANGGKGDPAEERWIEALEAGADALTLIQQLEAQVPKWISVKERLPEGRALAINDRGEMLIGAVSQRYYNWDESVCVCEEYEASSAIIDVTHWMPLPPEPPEEEKDEEP